MFKELNLIKKSRRAHILIGLATAVENIDEIIRIIKNSKDLQLAKKSFIKKWKVKKSAKLIQLIEKEKIRCTLSVNKRTS